MKKYLLYSALFLALTGCASFDPKSGMTFEQFKSMTAYSFNGGVISLGQLSGTNIEIYETSGQSFKRVKMKESTPAEGWQYFYFSNGKLLDQKDIQLIVEQSAAQQKKIEQERAEQQKKLELERTANEKLRGKQNTQKNSNSNSNSKVTLTEAILIQVAPVHLQTRIFEVSQRQWNNNVRYGAAPISSAYIRMINQEVPELYRNLTVCSKKYGGGEINPQTIMNLINSEESLRVQFTFLELTRNMVQTPTRGNLNSASEYELVLRLLLNKFQNEMKYKTDKKMFMNWCDTVGAIKFAPNNSK